MCDIFITENFTQNRNLKFNFLWCLNYLLAGPPPNIVIIWGPIWILLRICLTAAKERRGNLLHNTKKIIVVSFVRSLPCSEGNSQKLWMIFIYFHYVHILHYSYWRKIFITQTASCMQNFSNVRRLDISHMCSLVSKWTGAYT